MQNRRIPVGDTLTERGNESDFRNERIFTLNAGNAKYCDQSGARDGGRNPRRLKIRTTPDKMAQSRISFGRYLERKGRRPRFWKCKNFYVTMAGKRNIVKAPTLERLTEIPEKGKFV